MKAGKGKEINVEICTGTTCYVMGASELLMLEDYIPAELAGRIVIKGSPCLGLCRNRSLKAPFVIVNGRVLSQATVPAVMDLIAAAGKGETDAHNE